LDHPGPLDYGENALLGNQTVGVQLKELGDNRWICDVEWVDNPTSTVTWGATF
jgi:hypothetical protein